MNFLTLVERAEKAKVSFFEIFSAVCARCAFHLMDCNCLKMPHFLTTCIFIKLSRQAPVVQISSE